MTSPSTPPAPKLSACCQAPINRQWLPQGYQLSVLQGITHIARDTCSACGKELTSDGRPFPELKDDILPSSAGAGYKATPQGEGLPNGDAASSAPAAQAPTPDAERIADRGQWIEAALDGIERATSRPLSSEHRAAICLNFLILMDRIDEEHATLSTAQARITELESDATYKHLRNMQITNGDLTDKLDKAQAENARLKKALENDRLTFGMMKRVVGVLVDNKSAIDGRAIIQDCENAILQQDKALSTSASSTA